MRLTKHIKMYRALAITLLITVFSSFVGLGCAQNDNNIKGNSTEIINETLEENDANLNVNQSNEENNPEVEPDTAPEPEVDTFTDIRISAAGDIMFHGSQLSSAYDEASDSYDFNSVFADIKPIIEEADLALVNLETTLGGKERGFIGYPRFNSPDEGIDAIKTAGFDVITTVNNHSLDTGSEGLKRTVQVIREKGLDSVGTYDTKPDSRVLIKNVKGIEVAILAYTESTNGLGDQYPVEDLKAMLNLMDPEIIREDIREAKDLNADLIITFMHWGQEYMDDPNATQTEFAELMAEEGVDIILGSHPHVIQKSDIIKNDERETFVIYSMGNFVSNQRRETLGENRVRTEDGVIVNIDVQKNDRTNKTTIQNVEYNPTWVYRNMEAGQSQFTYRILPIENFLDDDSISEMFRGYMQHSLEATLSKMDRSLSE